MFKQQPQYYSISISASPLSNSNDSCHHHKLHVNDKDTKYNRSNFFFVDCWYITLNLPSQHQRCPEADPEPPHFY
jgi:hypothetical protein